MLKIRQFNNYKALFNTVTKQTLRLRCPKERLMFPELLDISLGTYCGGRCPYCYTNAREDGEFYQNCVNKIEKWFGNMSVNERPFQVAIGGGGEPTIHPEFVDVLKAFTKFGIVPNYTTNGMHITPAILSATKKYCGGVAISCHPHLNWMQAVSLLYPFSDLSLHIVIGNNGSVDQFKKIFKAYAPLNLTFVLLPYQSIGRAKHLPVTKEFEALTEFLLTISYKKLAFGALFHEWFKKDNTLPNALNISMYNPDILSGYVTLDSENLVIKKSSFNPTPV